MYTHMYIHMYMRTHTQTHITNSHSLTSIHWHEMTRMAILLLIF